MESRVHRGSYGPVPVHVMRWSELLRLRASVMLTGVLGRHLAIKPLRFPDSIEQQMLARCAERAAFPMLQFFRMPKDFRIVAAENVAGGRDAVNIRLEDGRRRWFELSQRLGWLNLLEELTIAGVPFTRVPTVSTPVFVVHGRYGGEPIDHSYWGSRRAVVLEYAGLRMEVRETIGAGPGLAALVRCAVQIRSSQRRVNSKAVDK